MIKKHKQLSHFGVHKMGKLDETLEYLYEDFRLSIKSPGRARPDYAWSIITYLAGYGYELKD